MAFDRRETVILLVGDFLILVSSLWVALFFRNLSLPPLGYFEANFVPFLSMFCISLLVFYISGLYEKQTRPVRRVMSFRIFGAQAATVAISAILFFILPLSIAPKTILILYLVISVVAESAWRFNRMNTEMREGKRESATLFGSGHAEKELYDEINGNGRYLMRFDDYKDTSESTRIEVRTNGGIAVIDFAALYEEVFDRVPLEHIDASQLLETLSKHHIFYDRAKRVFDILLALTLAVLTLPFVALAAIILSVDGGQPFIRPGRVGKNGRVIYLLKLRTMLFNDNGDPELQKKNRITTIGQFLRRTRIDELPQLWNVLTGDLSFIGPRPEFSKIAEVYERELPHYHLRHLITPGLSGWAQINDYDAPRGGADVIKTKRKLSYDLYYLKHRSFGLDVTIAIKTLRALASLTGT